MAIHDNFKDGEPLWTPDLYSLSFMARTIAGCSQKLSPSFSIPVTAIEKHFCLNGTGNLFVVELALAVAVPHWINRSAISI